MGAHWVRVNSEHEQCCHVLTYQHILVHKRLHRSIARVFQSHIYSVCPKQHDFCSMAYQTSIVQSQFSYVLERKLLDLLLRFGSKLVYCFCTLTTILYVTYITLVLSCHHLSKVESSQLTFTFTMGTSSCLLGESPPCADFLTLCTISPDFLL